MPRKKIDGFPDLERIIEPGWKVADYGGGTNPSPFASVVVDIDVSSERWEGVNAREKGLEVREGDCTDLRSVVRDKEFDFVVASHVAEHVDNPIAFCQEMMRTSRAGYIETPSPLYEVLFAWDEHKWVVDARGDRLCFSARTQENNPAWEWFNSFDRTTARYEHLRSAHAPWLRTRFLWFDDFSWSVEG